MKEEGWMFQNKKIKYWFYYYENGNKKEEGHYANNQKTDWWILYHKNVNISKKMTYKSNELHGFTFIYENEEVVKAQQFPNGNVIQEWTSYDNYKKDNPDFFRW
jgi:antitoxin component YwqK of YwqJK toxin-antitoxin module